MDSHVIWSVLIVPFVIKIAETVKVVPLVNMEVAVNLTVVQIVVFPQPD